MKYQRLGIDDSDALGQSQKGTPIKLVKSSPLRRLDFILRVLEREFPNKVSSFIQELQHLYDDIEIIHHEIPDESFVELIKDYPNLETHITLTKRNADFSLTLLGIPPDANLEQEHEVTLREFLRAFLIPQYYNIHALCNTLGRKEGIEFYKNYTKEIIETLAIGEENQYETLEDWVEYSMAGDSEDRGVIRIWGEIENGKVLIRKDTCTWAQALQDLPDQELKYYVLCYGDFFSIKAMNRHFVLTMEHTIVQGHPYCDCVIHDIRINPNIFHPSDDFFAGIWKLPD